MAAPPPALMGPPVLRGNHLGEETIDAGVVHVARVDDTGRAAVRRLVALATVLARVRPKDYQRGILAGRARLLEALLQRDMRVGRLIVGPRRAECADRQKQRARNSHALNHKP